MTSEMMKRSKKMKKRIFAIPAALAASPVKPNSAAMMAMIKNMADHESITTSLGFAYLAYRMKFTEDGAFGQSGDPWF